MVEEANLGKIVNVERWLKENEESFKPPVCNSVMAKGFLNIMFVGGPNVRKDYHIEQGEELFYMVKGDMCLKIMEKGKPKDVNIKEGEIFVLPSRIPHSPQRNPNTLGLVIERQRSDQYDCLRYYCEDSKTILYQKYFHLHSLVKDFPAIIKEYFASEQFKTGIPIPGTTDENNEKLKVDVETVVDQPFLLSEWVQKYSKEISNKGKELFGNGEFKVFVIGGKYEFQNDRETWLWVKCMILNFENSLTECKIIILTSSREYIQWLAYEEDGAECCIDGKSNNLEKDDSIIIMSNQRVTVNIKDAAGYAMLFSMDPTATPQK